MPGDRRRFVRDLKGVREKYGFLGGNFVPYFASLTSLGLRSQDGHISKATVGMLCTVAVSPSQKGCNE